MRGTKSIFSTQNRTILDHESISGNFKTPKVDQMPGCRIQKFETSDKIVTKI